jgi:hypothetical protein
LREPRARKRRNSGRNKEDVGGVPSSADFDFDSLFADDKDDDTSLDSIFKRKTSNPFDNSTNFSKVIEESELEELAKKDTNIIYTTGYSIHTLTPYLALCILICFGFMIVDKYFFNIVEYLSQDIRYKLPFYGVVILILVVLTYLFIRKSFEYMNFTISMTKYKIIYGWKFLKKKNELTLFSINESLNKKGLLGLLLNYGNLQFYTTQRRKYSFDTIHGAYYIYELVNELQHGANKGLGQNEAIKNILSDGRPPEEDQEKKSKNKKNLGSDNLNGLADLGFTEDELKEFGMIPTSKSKNNKQNEEDDDEEDSEEADTTSADVSAAVDAPVATNSGGNSRSSGRRSSRQAGRSSGSSSSAERSASASRQRRR